MSDVVCLHHSGEGAPLPLGLERVCRFFAVAFGMKGIDPFDFDEASPGVFLPQPSP